MAETHVESKSSFLERVVVFLTCTMYAWFLGMIRPIASDEGFYSVAAQEVLKGHHPYLDFFYPQAPVFPYLYGVWLSCFGVSWVSARWCTIVFMGLLGLIVYQLLRSVANKVWSAIGLLVLFLSTLVIAWFPTVKFFTPTATFLLMGLYCGYQAEGAKSRPWWFLAGACPGIACGIRSYVILCVVPMLFFFQDKEDFLRFGKWFFFGLACALLPHAFYFLLDSDSYLYNNLYYHLQRSSLPDERRLSQKLVIVQRLFGFILDKKTPDPQYGILFLLSTLLTLRFWKAHPRITRVSYGMALSVFMISLLPTPTWEQYFSITVPFLVIPLAVGSYYVWSSRQALMKGVLVLLLLIYSASGVLELHSYYQGEKKLPGPGNLSLSPIQLDELGEMIEEHTEPGQSILSLWPGYLFGVNRNPVPGMENQFWVRVPETMLEEDRKRYHVMSRRKLKRIITEGRYRYVITERARRLTNAKLLKRAGYIVQNSQYGVYLWSYKTQNAVK